MIQFKSLQAAFCSLPLVCSLHFTEFTEITHFTCEATLIWLIALCRDLLTACHTTLKILTWRVRDDLRKRLVHVQEAYDLSVHWSTLFPGPFPWLGGTSPQAREKNLGTRLCTCDSC